MPEIDFDAEPAPDAYDTLCKTEPGLAIDLMKRATIGALQLDTVRPRWYRAVRLDLLDQSTPDRDVVAQVFGSSRRGLETLKGLRPSGPWIGLAASGMKLTEGEATYCDNPDCPARCPSKLQVEARLAALTALWVWLVKGRLAGGEEVARA